jgi:DNA-binding IclR family transcriptional regulator
MTSDRHTRVEQACHELAAAGKPVTAAQVAARTGIARSTLYRHAELRAVIEEHRQRHRDAFTLTGMAIQIDQLRAGVEALAARVRHHEEELRRINRNH